jgi:hypothetical protein
MIRLTQTLIIGAISGAIGLFALAGCTGSPQASAPEASPSASSQAMAPQSSPSTGAMATDTAQPTGKFAGLQGVVSKTEIAVQAGDKAKAKDEFDKFEDFWSKVEDGVKAKSSETYNAIEDNADQVSGQLKAPQLDKEKALTALKSLKAEVDKAAQS